MSRLETEKERSLAEHGLKPEITMQIWNEVL